MCYGPFSATLVLTPDLKKLSRNRKFLLNILICASMCFGPFWATLVWPQILRNYPKIEEKLLLNINLCQIVFWTILSNFGFGFWISNSVEKCVLDHFEQLALTPYRNKISLSGKKVASEYLNLCQNVFWAILSNFGFDPRYKDILRIT